MEVTDAITLENWFPTTGDVEVRGGSTAYSTGITGDVETLAIHTAMDGTEQLFAVTDTDCYDVSVAGAASAETWTDQDDGKYQWLNFGDGTTNWLAMFNGVDLPKYYNGSTWVEVTGVSTPAITGLTTTTIVSACEYQGRLFLLEKDSLSFWYLTANSVGGAATEFDLSSFANRGGYIMWAATWTFDAGDGIDDYIVFMTSEGEALIYNGTDPATAANWIKTGTYYLGKPLGRRSFVQFGGDLLAVTQEGVFNMSEGLKYAKINERVALTDKIKSAFNLAARSYGSAFGWQALNHSLKNAMIFNIPISAGSQQYVVNTITGAWCNFKGWDTNVLVIYNDELYFGGSTTVTKAWIGRSDSDANIVAEAQQSFTNFNVDSQSKQINLYRPMLKANGNLAYLVDLEVDFDPSIITGTASYTTTSAAVWDTATWDSGTWQGGLQTIRQWNSPAVDIGYYFSGKIKIETNTTEVHWVSSDYVYEQGGIIG